MAIFKCKICGGSLDVSDGSSVAVCEYCGTKQTVPTTKDDVVANLFNRANNLRLKCEFDKAEQVYEKILDIDNTDSEGHWGVVLCKYGIEYVDDVKTGNKIPTCHRTLYDAVLTDIDYLAAIENADAEQKELYVAEAKMIDELQKNILNIVNNEEPFDVFICYKETDENGKRTVDSTIANDIYYQLTQEGFKVFYAPITLEDKLGYEYEPYIFAALNSAKVMLVIGTKSEHFDAVWVRNEWSRYLKIMKADRSKLLIPCYKDMDAYELPDEFAHLQAQDMGKIGFISDVIRGLRKVLNRDNVVQPTISKKVKVKKNNKLKAVIDKYKKKWQEKKKYCLMFPLNLISKAFYLLSILLYLYFGIKVMSNLNNSHDALIFSLYTIMGMLIPTLISAKVIKNKITSIILQVISLSLYILLCFMDIPYMIEYGFYVFVILSTLLTLIWFILICFSKRVTKASLKKHRPIKIIIPAIMLSALIIGTMEFGGIDFCNYQIAKGFYKIGEYSYGYYGFTYLEDYKDSKSLANKSKLAEIKNAELFDVIYFGDYATDDFSSWDVISKENDSVLLSQAYSVIKNPSDCNILGGWKKSSIREFLNGAYMDVAFDDYIKERILTTRLINSTDIADITEDKIFILSKEETLKYFSSIGQIYSYRNSMMRNVENNIYTIYTPEEFYQIQFNGDIIPQKDANGDGKITLSEWAEFYSTSYNTEEIEMLSDAVYKPALWLDVSDIEG